MDFSVIIPAYNVSGIIARAIRSAAAQTFPPLEILVINDCSTDDTIEVVNALEREIPSLRLLSTPTNGGPSAARNVGLRAAERNGSPCLMPTMPGSRAGLSACRTSPLRHQPTSSPMI
jgi:glycosyltransferase involved in cell wall biosynthesis